MPTSLSVYAMRFQKGGEQVISLWSQFPATVALEGSGRVEVVNNVGSPITINPAAVAIGPNPIYVTGNVTGINELVNPIIADSRSGFGGYREPTAGATDTQNLDQRIHIPRMPFSPWSGAFGALTTTAGLRQEESFHLVVKIAFTRQAELGQSGDGKVTRLAW